MLKLLAQLCFGLFGWKVIGRFPAGIWKSVVIVAPHTSNWDFIVGVIAAKIIDLKYRFLGKKEIFVPPFSAFFRWLGGIPVERTKHTNLVDFVVDIFHKTDDLILGMSPEGTRKKINKWHSGFYYIAFKAKVPIVTVYMDYNKKEVGFGPVLNPSGDYLHDIEILRNFYRTITAKYPENFEKEFE
ncbi:MAG: 1-acyl-sn-glycerol-3-phosphate acyltransferase [Bacteroidetes bacterium]|nr:1-acyl-sn-glycerol-3-phosphate acyltransferase [Bacteroidota bacterium]